MRKMPIRSRILLLFSVSMVIVIFITFLLVRMISASVMKNTLSDYLMSAVDINAEKLVYLDEEQAKSAQKTDTDDLFIEYGNGYLQIDDDFLDILNDVESALYTSGGDLLYGNNPLSKEMEGEPFVQSRLYEKEIGGERYIIYDRRFTETELAGLWIRGIVPLTQQELQLTQITKSVSAFLPLLVLIIIIVSVFIAMGILRPISRMKETAVSIADGEDLERRIETDNSKDEMYALAQTFNDMFDRLQASFEREKQFTSDASHELRTPLSVILMQAEYAASHEMEKEDYRESFEVVERQANRMKSLVDDLLSLVRIGQGEKRFPMEQLDISGIYGVLCEDMARVAYRGIKLTAEIEPGLRINANRGLMERLLVNLIDNAYKYGKENGHTVVRVVREGENLRISVADDGIGISDEMKEKIFDRFFRVDQARSGAVGYGLGLSLVSEIARMYGGDVEVSDVEGGGSVFAVELPSLFS